MELPATRAYKRGSRSRHLEASWALEQEADAALAEMEAALAERDRMLRVARERDFTHLGDYETWFNDVKLTASAEEAKP